MKKNKYKYKIYIDKNPIAMVIGSEEYANREISHYFNQYLDENFKEIKIIREVLKNERYNN